MSRWLAAVGVLFLTGACTNAAIPEATRVQANAIAEVADATKEDVNRCEHGEPVEVRAKFCERARKHCDEIHRQAAELAASAK